MGLLNSNVFWSSLNSTGFIFSKLSKRLCTNYSTHIKSSDIFKAAGELTYLSWTSWKWFIVYKPVNKMWLTRCLSVNQKLKIYQADFLETVKKKFLIIFHCRFNDKKLTMEALKQLENHIQRQIHCKTSCSQVKPI